VYDRDGTAHLDKEVEHDVGTLNDDEANEQSEHETPEAKMILEGTRFANKFRVIVRLLWQLPLLLAA
jgi:hypothetical protein